MKFPFTCYRQFWGIGESDFLQAHRLLSKDPSYGEEDSVHIERITSEKPKWPQTKIFLIRKVLAVTIKSFVTGQRHSLKTGLKNGREGTGNIFPLPLNGGSHVLPSLQWFFCYQDPGLCYHFTSKFEAAMSAWTSFTLPSSCLVRKSQTLLLPEWLIVQLCSAQSWPALCDPIGCSPPGFSVHRIFQPEYWSGFPFSPLGDLPDPGIQWASPVSPALQMNSLPTEPSGKTRVTGANGPPLHIYFIIVLILLLYLTFYLGKFQSCINTIT